MGKLYKQCVSNSVVILTMLTVLSGCSLISVSLPSSLFGVDDNPSQSQQDDSLWGKMSGQDAEPALQNRRRPAYNPGGATGGGNTQMPGYQENMYSQPGSGSYRNQQPDLYGSQARGRFLPYNGGGFGDYAPRSRQDAAPPGVFSDSGAFGGNTGAPAPSIPSGGGYALPNGPSDSDMQHQMQNFGFGENSQGTYNPFIQHHTTTRFEPMSSSYTLTTDKSTDTYSDASFSITQDDFPRLTSVPDIPEEIYTVKEDKYRIQQLEHERDQANELNRSLRGVETKSSKTPEIAPAPAHSEPQETPPSILDMIQSLITF